MFALVTNCEDKKKDKMQDKSDAEKNQTEIPHDSLLVPEHQTPPIIPVDKEYPPKKNDSI